MNKTMEMALRLLTRREHSQQELTQKLLRKFSEEEVAPVISKCCQQGLVDNQRFLESRIRHRVQQGYGPEWIKQDLYPHQIEEELLSQFMNFDEGFWVEQATNLVIRKYKTRDVNAEKPKIQRYLYQRGYSVAVIQQAMKTIFSHDD